MNEALITHWNDCVAQGNTVYHLGDLFLCSLEEARAIRRRLHGNTCLIRGNHGTTADRMKESFGWVKDYYEMKVPDTDEPSGKLLLFLCHIMPFGSGAMHTMARGTCMVTPMERFLAKVTHSTDS